MSRDIRSFFPVSPKKSGNKIESPIVKRKATQIYSDDDDIVPVTPTDKSKKPSKKNKKRRVIESDEEDVVPSKAPVSKKPNLSKLKTKEDKLDAKQKPSAADLKALFGQIPKRTERIKRAQIVPTNNKEEDVVLLSDDEFNDAINMLDDVPTSKNHDVIKTESKTPLKAEVDSTKNEDTKLNISPVKTEIQNLISVSKKTKSPQKSPPKKISPEKCSKISVSKKINSPQKSPPKKISPEKRSPMDTKDQIYTNDKIKLPAGKLTTKKDDFESSVLDDETRHERRQRSIALYHQYKNRPTALKHGSKEIPKGKPDCLKGLSFVVTGVLESLEREEACELIKNLGGKVTATVGKRLNYMVVGEEAGPKKLAMADELQIQILSEDGLFELIKSKSELSSKTIEKNPTKIKIAEISKNSIKKESNKNIMKTESQNLNTKIQNESPQKRKFIEEKSEREQHANEKNFKKLKSESPKSRNINSENEIIECDAEKLAWVDKYKPTSVKQIIGQQGEASNSAKLQNWLSKWFNNHDGKKKLQKPNPWAKNDDGSYFKAALLSGPPGIGKTTTANLVCKELGFDIVEFNASDTRSKKLLKEEVSELLSNKSLFGYFHGSSNSVSKKHVLIMDEVDGMAGNEDRGGIQELIGLIKESSVPIICMCNDRNHQKMRSLVNYCYDLRFSKPRLVQIKGAIMSICFKEKFQLPSGKIEEIITATNNDIRQTINHLSLLCAGKELKLNSNDTDKTASKDLKLGPWEVVRKVFSKEDKKHMSMNDKSDLFFHDYSMGPLFVQQNYLSVSPSVPKAQVIQQVALTADSLSLGDLVDKRIRSNSAWTLLPVQAMFSSVMPGEFMEGHFTGQINFPGWLGKYSKANKRSRLAQEVHDHTRARTSGSRRSIRMDYAPFLLDAIVRPLKANGLDGVEESLAIIKEYRLLREDIDSLIELSAWPGKKNPMDSVESKVKAALTRSYNKEVMPYSYSAMAGVKKKKADTLDAVDLDTINEEDNDDTALNGVSDEEDEEKIENDALIKSKKKSATNSKAAAPTDANPSTKKPKTSKVSKSKA